MGEAEVSLLHCSFSIAASFFLSWWMGSKSFCKVKSVSVCVLCVRKSFLAIGCRNSHLKGIAGPGAPHVFAFDRAEDLPGE